ncbi:MAG TPA: metal ABC transporter ATP-binding protein [Candidatus Marinimicrobia bacterium]|nr:metal ABC transporter ATP-binding protein [Candidatus Neomarinimicrobiota bacterium]
MSLFSRKHEPHGGDQPILRLRNVAVRYESGLALDDVNFAIEPGEQVAVIGPNGAGKSTLFKVISGILKPSSGSVEIFGSHPEGHICIGYVPQRSQVDWRFPVNVAEVVMMGRVGKIGFFRRPKKRDWERVYDALETVSLADMSERQINQLSGGQQQRVFIAQSLAQEAELMLMDEPFTGLDVNSQEDIFQVIEKLRERKVTLLVSIHDLKLAAKRFPKLMLINRTVRAFGKAAEVCQSQTLLEAYGGQLHIVSDDSSLFAFDQGGHTEKELL